MVPPSEPPTPSADHIRRAASSHLIETTDCSTGTDLGRIEVLPDGRILAVLELSMGAPNRSSSRRSEFSDRDIRDLRAMAEMDPRPEVRQAATAVLCYALGSSLAESATGTPYGIGWVRGLLRAIREDGLQALRTRNYRRVGG